MSKPSLMQQYSDIYGIPMQEVKQWCVDYANGNVPDSVKEWMESDKQSRIESIKSYIQQMVDQSLSNQIKGDLLSSRLSNSQSKQVVNDICPF